MLSDILTNFFYTKQKIKEPFELSYSIKKRKQSPQVQYTLVYAIDKPEILNKIGQLKC